MAAVDDHRRPIDRARGVEALKQRLVQALPDTGRLPSRAAAATPSPPNSQAPGAQSATIPVTSTNTIALNVFADERRTVPNLPKPRISQR
jgi:hypothetical protein